MADPYSLGNVNVDSLKEALLFLSTVYPFADEIAKERFTTQVNALDSSGNPTENVDPLHAVLETNAATGATLTSTEAETAAEQVTEAAAEAKVDQTSAAPEGASALTSATASPITPEMSANDKIAELEAQLADAKAAAAQTPPETA